VESHEIVEQVNNGKEKVGPMENPRMKSETRNPKQTSNPKHRIFNVNRESTRPLLDKLIGPFRSFGFRISSFGFVLTAFFLVVFPFCLVAFWDDPSASKASRAPVVVSDEAMRMHRAALVIDGHNDLPWQFRKKDDLSFKELDISRPQPRLHTDIPRLRKGGVGAQFWSAYVSSATSKRGTAVRETLEQIDVIHRLARRYPDAFALALTSDDVMRIRRDGKIACLIGVEGGHSIDNSLGVLRMYYALGVRYLTLTHTDSIDWADSATDAPKCNGLSAFGEDVVREMNRLGMLVDISHVSVATMKHALRISKAPIIASHSSAFALANHPRNVPDDVLKLVAANGGVVMVNFFPAFIVPEAARLTRDMGPVFRQMREKYPSEAEFEAALDQWRRENPFPTGSVHAVVDHIDHIVKVAGVDHVGLGSDYDGITVTPKQLEDVSCYPFITQELLNRGYGREAILKILGGNALRAMQLAERVSRDAG
jgi:membrane dipeptidase